MFLVDAQLPRRFCDWLRENGHDALHTLDLEMGNRTTDSDIILIADREGRAATPTFFDTAHSHPSAPCAHPAPQSVPSQAQESGHTAPSPLVGG